MNKRNIHSNFKPLECYCQENSPWARRRRRERINRNGFCSTNGKNSVLNIARQEERVANRPPYTTACTAFTFEYFMDLTIWHVLCGAWIHSTTVACICLFYLALLVAISLLLLWRGDTGVCAMKQAEERSQREREAKRKKLWKTATRTNANCNISKIMTPKWS